MNMKNIFKKENLKPVIVLLAICVVVAALLGAVNLLTEERIEDNEQQKVFESLKEAMDGHITPIKNLPDGTPKSVTGMYEVRENASSDTLKGKIVTLVVKGYAGDISMTVGVKADGTVSKVVITSQSESHGKAGMASYPDKFKGVGADEVGSVELFTGATVSSTAIRGGVADAIAAATGAGSSEPEEEETLPKTDAEIIALSKTLIGADIALTDITPEEGNTYLKRLYKADGKGYIAYLLVISPEYGTPETETLIHFDNSGKIVAVNKLTWKTSDAIYGYEPPTEETVNAFYDKLAGNTSASFAEKFVKAEGEDKEVEHVSNATNTTNRLVASISEAFTFVDELVRLDMPREESEVIELSKALVGEGATLTDITPKSGNTYLKRLYKAGEEGFVAYLVVISPNYGTPETETLIHFDNSGKIVSVNKLTWKTSDAIYGYEPPTEETVKAFYDKLAGNTSKSFSEKFIKAEGEDKEVEHVANATNTTNRLVASIAEAFDFVDGLTQTAEQGGSNGARIVGIIILSLGILCPVGLAVFKKIRGRKEN
ncbi:MAG: FMN-binding protein [Clostridia bacterium]|nr:FMN-binding protein [Clostridia bacterium]